MSLIHLQKQNRPRWRCLWYKNRKSHHFLSLPWSAREDRDREGIFIAYRLVSLRRKLTLIRDFDVRFKLGTPCMQFLKAGDGVDCGDSALIQITFISDGRRKIVGLLCVCACMCTSMCVHVCMHAYMCVYAKKQ